MCHAGMKASPLVGEWENPDSARLGTFTQRARNNNNRNHNHKWKEADNADQRKQKHHRRAEPARA